MLLLLPAAMVAKCHHGAVLVAKMQNQMVLLLCHHGAAGCWLLLQLLFLAAGCWLQSPPVTPMGVVVVA